ncbi:MAG: META domain-containing protein [Pseudomonadota bacterium]
MLRHSPIAALLGAALSLAACGGGGGDTAPPAATNGAAAVAPASASVPAGATSGALAGTTWDALTLNGTTVTTAPAPTLAFDRGGRVSASGGCNTFSGTVRVGNGGIAFDDAFAGTARACVGDLEARDRAMLQALRDATRFATSGERLTLFDASGSPVALLLPAL